VTRRHDPEVPDDAAPAAEARPAGADRPVVPGTTVPGTAVGPELARAVLDAARAKRAEHPPRTAVPRGAGRRLRGYSGPGPDPRDPQPFGAMLNHLMTVRGWHKRAAQARLFGLWSTVVGAELAGHCRPVKLEDGELIVEAESTAWATQIRLLGGKVLARISGDLGPGVVTRLTVRGPVSPSWVKGPRSVRGRGPRDTYG
jgi:predicted nucleic acid-binding Zn ribbon protein